MNPSMILPRYKRQRIASLDALQAALGVSVEQLQSLAEHADNSYRVAKSVIKPDGSTRHTYDAFKPLKDIHRKIKNHILDHVAYPSYLTGSIKGCDYKVNAEIHTQAKIVISEDITAFFPSTTAKKVFKIWRDFFGFNSDVARCLTRLTTRKNELPQGAITSSFLANLVFWQSEPFLYEQFSMRHLKYSRYVDDIVVSSKSFLDDVEKTEVICQIYGMLLTNGYHPKRAKHEISTSASRMEVTKLAVNIKPGLKKAKKSMIRAAVHRLETLISEGKEISFESGDFVEVMGQVQHMKRFHPGKAEALIKRLNTLKLSYIILHNK
ncbi:reverse transcriptase family protein [Yersinia pseudotuberculosis]|uniref:reverse transcriptase family protein n=1 Tax=Yersinia pseudotuberculosis TaxID=633 RepID=UPI0038B4DAFD